LDTYVVHLISPLLQISGALHGAINGSCAVEELRSNLETAKKIFL
jgi:hypothetical protein